MPVPQEKLTELTELLVDQMLREFREAATAGKSIDPRRIVAAQRLLETSNPKAFKPAAEYDEAGQVVPEKKSTDSPEQRATVARVLADLKAKGKSLPFPDAPEERTDGTE